MKRSQHISPTNNYSIKDQTSTTQQPLSTSSTISTTLTNNTKKRKSQTSYQGYQQLSNKRNKCPARAQHQVNIALSQAKINPSTGKLSSSCSNSSFWGHHLLETPTSSNSTRIAFRNINSLPPSLPDPRHDQLLQDLRTGQFDIIGIAETNLRWHRVPNQDKPRQRFKSAFEHTHVAYSYNLQDYDYLDKRQSGGTMIISKGVACNRIISWGSDERKLGRWTWVLYRGTPSPLRIVTIYRPVLSNNIHGAYKQQQTYLLSIGITTCPRTLLLDDLQKLIIPWQSNGEHVIILGDFNESIDSKALLQFRNSCNLHEGLLQLHGPNTPNTFQHGTKTIDSICLSNDVQAIHAGYTATDWGITTDHRLLWIDINNQGIFNTNEPPPWKPQARRLKRSDSRTVHSFLQHRLSHATSFNLLSQIQSLQDQLHADNISISEAQLLLNDLDHIRTCGILQADKKCRRLCMGGIPWSPELSEIIFQIQYFKKHISSILSKSSIHSRTLFKLRRRAKLTTIPQSLEEARIQLSTAFDKFRQLKLQAPLKRSQFLEELAAANAIANNTDYESTLKQILDREHIKSTFAKIKYVFQSQRSSVTQIETPDSDNNWTIKSTKQEVEQGCMDENTRRFTQASNTPLMHPDQISLLGWTADTFISQTILQGSSTPYHHLFPEGLATLAPLLMTPSPISEHGQISTSLSYEDMVYFCMRSNPKRNRSKVLGNLNDIRCYSRSMVTSYRCYDTKKINQYKGRCSTYNYAF